MTTMTITVDMGKKCAECGKGGAVANGLCLSCTSNAMQGRRMKSQIGKAVQLRFKASIPASE